MRRMIMVVALAGAMATVAVSVLAQGSYDLSWHTVDAGGGHSEGGPFALEGTIGQPDAGVHTGGDFTVIGGFWSVALASPSPTATATLAPSPTASRTPGAGPSPSATALPTATVTPEASATASATATPLASVTPGARWQLYLPLVHRE